MSTRPPRSGRRLTGVAVVLAVALAIGGVYLWQNSSAGTARSHVHAEMLTQAANNSVKISEGKAGKKLGKTAGKTTATTSTPKRGQVCGQQILRSPFDYMGKTGNYASGTDGLPTYGKGGTDFPNDTNGVVLPVGSYSLQTWQLRPNTVYYLLPGVHVSNILADMGDAFVGGYAKGTGTTLTGGYDMDIAIDSNSTVGNTPSVTIEYLTIEQYHPGTNQAAINQEANSGWTIMYNTIAYNVPGAGVIAGSGNVIKDNCFTLNGQYGFQSEDTNGYAADRLTGGPYGILIIGNEISFNDTCDYSGRLNNAAVGWKNYDPVPAEYRNSHCGTVVPDGDQGGFKLWTTDGVTVESNYIHDNWGTGGWADTDNANTTWIGNLFVHNENAAIIEEVSYNFSITNNTMTDNNWADGLANSGFPQPAIYISESGSDTTFGGVPACSYAACKDMGSYPRQSVIAQNLLVNNGGGIFLWENSNRACGDGYDVGCTLVDGAPKSPFQKSSCAANLAHAKVNLSTWVGEKTGSPSEDWWDGCLWHVENVLVTQNTIDFNPADIPNCNKKAWLDCGANGIFSEYGGSGGEPGWTIPTDITFFQHNLWTKNVYNGPSTFWAWNQGNGVNPVSWQEWTGSRSRGDMCTSAGARQSGYCGGPFGEDAGGTYNKSPLT